MGAADARPGAGSPSVIPTEGEHLTTGWEPDLPPGDTLVRRAVLVHASWAPSVARSLDRPWRRTERWTAGRVSDVGTLSNGVVVLRPLAEGEWTEVLREVSDVLPPPVPFLLVSPFPTPDLRAHGLTLLGHPPLMARLPGGEAPPAPDGVRVLEVGSAEELAAAERVLVEGFPMPEVQPLQRGSVLAPGLLDQSTRVWLGLLDDAPVAVAAGHVAHDAVLVEYVATLPVARGRGAGAAVTWAATLAAPGLPAVLIASDDGRPVYERMGFLAVERWTAWMREPGR